MGGRVMTERADNGRRCMKTSCRRPECHRGETRGKIDRGGFPLTDISALCCGEVGWPSGGRKVKGLHLVADLTLVRGHRVCVLLHSKDDERVDTYGKLKVRRWVCVSRAWSLEHLQPQKNHKEHIPSFHIILFYSWEPLGFLLASVWC